MKVRFVKSAWNESEEFLKECDLTIGSVYKVTEELSDGSLVIFDDKEELNSLYKDEYEIVEENVVE